MRFFTSLSVLLLTFQLSAQTFWTEAFQNGCGANCFANAYVGPNGAWTTTNTGPNGSDPNIFYVSGAECGNIPPACGTACGGADPSLHVGSNPSVIGDGGAAYLAGGLGFWFPETNVRAESPVINCTGQTNITLSFGYIEFGQGLIDNATLWYFNGVAWAQLIDLAKTACCGGPCNGSLQGQWTTYTQVLPASANNNPNVRIGFNWTNNDDNVGTDPSFAVDDITLSVVGGAPPVAAFTASSTNICAGQCINFTDNTTNAPTGWSWTFPGGVPATSTAQNPNNICYLAAGTYTVTLSASNAFGTSTATQTITVNPVPTVTVTPASPSYCQGGNATLTASGATTYTWSPSTALSATTGASVTASPTTTITYTVTGTGTGGCTDTQTVTVTVNPNPTVTISPAAPAYCQGGNINLTASGATTYAWSPATGLSATSGATVTANPTATTTYTITGTGVGNCTATATVTVTVNPLPTITITPNNPTYCTGGNVALTASGGNTYTWSPATALTCTNCANPTANPTSTTTYTITGTDINGCSATATVTVTVTASIIPTASATPPAICLNGSSTLNGGGGSGYSWTPTSSLSCSTCQNPVATPTTTTIYTVIVSGGGCPTATTTVTVTVNPLPTISVSPAAPSYCAGGNAPLTASGGSTYTWSPTTGLSATTGASPTASPTATTTYTVTGTDANGCTSTAAVTVTVNPLPSPIVNPAAPVICTGGNISITVTGGTTYAWSPATGLSATSGATVTASPATTSTYTITVTDANGCSATVTVTVTVNPCAPPVAVITASATTVCTPGCINFSDNSTGSPTTWSWTFAGGTPASSTAQNPGQVCFTSTGNHIVTLIVTNGSGSDTTTQTITVNQSPTANAGNSVTILSGQSTTLNATGGGTYSWTPATGLSCTNCQSPVASPIVTTTYCVLVTDSGCTDSSCVTVFVDVICSEVFLPTAFSPNFDGNNDYFYPIIPCFESMWLAVYDRWGEKVFESGDPNKKWDGTFRNLPLDAGVFVFYFHYTQTNGTDEKRSGNVTLAR